MSTTTMTTTMSATPSAAGAVELRPSWWRDTLVFAGRNVQHIRQIPEKLLDVTIQPLMFVLLFAYVFGGAIDVGGSYREYLVGGILIQTIGFGLIGPAMSIATDLTDGVIDRFRSLPAAQSSYLAGHLLAELGGMVLAISVLLGAGLVVGWRTHTGLPELLTAALLLLAFASAMVAVGTLIGLTVRTADSVMGVAFPSIFPLTFVSSAFVPLSTMPSFLETVAVWNPISTLVAAVRELFGNPPAPVSASSWPLEHPVLASFGCCALILAVVVPLCLHRFRARTTD